MAPPNYDEVVQLIHVIQNGSKLSNWSPALRAAPEAITVMAVCLRAASHPEAKAIDIKGSFLDLKGEKIAFPSQFLDTNLQHCSDLGRAAFREAESGMRKLQLNLEDILGAHGTIRSIVKLLDKPKAAKYQLRSNMDSLQDSAKNCIKSAQDIRDRFDRLVNFIMALHKVTKDKQGTTLFAQDQNLERTREQKANVGLYKVELEGLERQRAKDLGLLDQALKSVKEAEEAVDRANAATLDVPSHISTNDIERLVLISNPGPEDDDGAFTKAKQWAFGKSKEKKREQKLEARERSDAMHRQILAQREIQQKNIEANQAHAKLALDEARRVAAERQETFNKSSQEFRETSNKLLESAKSLENANHLLDQLGAEKVDLAETKKIIETSLESLTNFKHQIDTMLAYFQENADYVERLTSPSGQLGKTLAAIEGISMASGNEAKARIIKDLEVDPDDREVYTEHAMQLEGRFSLIYEIAGVYLEVSKRYIISGINRMEELAILTDGDYNRKKLEFQRFCHDAKAGIEGMSDERKARDIDRTVGRNLWTFAQKTKLIEGNPQFPDEVQEEDD